MQKIQLAEKFHSEPARNRQMLGNHTTARLCACSRVDDDADGGLSTVRLHILTLFNLKNNIHFAQKKRENPVVKTITQSATHFVNGNRAICAKLTYH